MAAVSNCMCWPQQATACPLLTTVSFQVHFHRWPMPKTHAVTSIVQGATFRGPTLCPTSVEDFSTAAQRATRQRDAWDSCTKGTTLVQGAKLRVSNCCLPLGTLISCMLCAQVNDHGRSVPRLLLPCLQPATASTPMPCVQHARMPPRYASVHQHCVGCQAQHDLFLPSVCDLTHDATCRLQTQEQSAT
jgi:hypothetical protein